jgi:hypothetical protein
MAENLKMHQHFASADADPDGIAMSAHLPRPPTQEWEVTFHKTFIAEPKALAELTGVPAARISEIKREISRKNSVGRPVNFACNEALARDITINGLTIVADELASASYYREHVTGGPRSFPVVAQERNAFASAIFDKFVKEIAWVPTDSKVADRHL